MTAAAQGVRPATPLPWELCRVNPQRVRCNNGGAFLGLPVLETRAIAGDAGSKDASYIVAACNAYPELVAALRYIARGYSGEVGNAEGHSGTHCAETARALLERLGE